MSCLLRNFSAGSVPHEHDHRISTLVLSFHVSYQKCSGKHQLVALGKDTSTQDLWASTGFSLGRAGQYLSAKDEL